ncbi:fumarate reductase (CoM/CoB) subunit TfrA [Methanolacinia petrolearia]|uniref:fumarate reductase (CoM/CoB) subunit TfrA n=1 Tax=Methanolacinia petrolearia TaxID=54120 RepID=UPI003BAABB98
MVAENTENIIECHVLVIGSGGAGTRAAIEAARYGDVVMMSRSVAGKGGCTPMAEGGFNAVLNPADCCTLHEEDTMKGGAYLNDPELVKTLVAEAPERMKDLIDGGAIFDLTPERQLAQRPFGGQRFNRTCYAGDRTGHEMMMTLVEHLRTENIKILHEISAIELLKSEGRVCGAAGLDRNGNLVVIKADAVVLATGGAGQIYEVNTNCATGNGQGFALAFRAGAELIDMEMVQFHPTGAVQPYDARGRLITEAARGEGGVLKNAKDERFMENYDPERMELSTRDVVARSIATEILEGRGTEKGGVYLDVSHLGDKYIEVKLPLMLEQFLNFGVDIRKEPMEVAPTAHHFMGGIRIDPHGATNVPGLFACGEVTGGVHGANRLGGNSLADTQVFGKRAGESAGKSSLTGRMIDPIQIDAIRAQLEGYLKGDKNPAEIQRRLKALMWEKAGIFRTEEGLKKALSELENLSKEKPRAKSDENLIDCCTVADMLTTAVLVVKGSLIRPESRGANMRTDLGPCKDPGKSPYSHTFLSLENSGIELKEGQ